MAAATSSRAVQHCLREGGDSPADELEGAKIATGLLRLGRLERPVEELLIAEDADEKPGSPRMLRAAPRAPEPPALPMGGPSAQPERERHLGPEIAAGDGSIVESDLLVQECDSEDEAIAPGIPPPSWAPGRMGGRRLMQSRARQCVVCMEEKEHTLVPPHRSDAGQHVDGHRFCTDCWREFLQHTLRRTPTGLPRHLTCPVCRDAISAPDVWGVRFELPGCWTKASGAASASAAGSSTQEPAEVSMFWASAVPRSEASAGLALARPEEGCRLASSWRSLGYFGWFCDACAGTTVVQNAGQDNEFRPSGW